jgi:putative membrane protein
MSSLFAFLHHIAAFALIAALVVEFVLLREALSLSIARKLQKADMIFGIAAGIVLVVGLVRVFFLEKGADYYFSNIPFMIKLTLFIVIGILSIYPTLAFLSWRRATKVGQLPVISASKVHRLKLTIHLELAAAAGLILCAVLMARGVGSV